MGTSTGSVTVMAIRATALTPFYYHGLYARDGSASHADVITDTALLFALRNALLGTPPALRSTPDYAADLQRIPWRASLFMGEGNALMPPVRHTIDVEREGGNHEAMQKNMGSGNFKKTFFVHEVALGASYSGVIVGPDIFQETDNFVVRVGVGRLGMLALRKADTLGTVRLNAATARLFERDDVIEEYRILDTIRVSVPFSLKEARRELAEWRS
jgi:hypothetical protein